jgi:hypothetical protein
MLIPYIVRNNEIHTIIIIAIETTILNINRQVLAVSKNNQDSHLKFDKDENDTYDVLLKADNVINNYDGS